MGMTASLQTISFPNLGFQMDIDPELVSFTLFNHVFSIKWYGVIIALGFLLAALYCFARARQFGLDPDRVVDVVLVSTLFAFVGARLYYVLFSGHLSEYLADPIRIINVTEGGLAIYGAVLLAFITGLWMCRVRKVPTLKMFDLASLGFLIGQGIGRWGNFVNQEAFGGNSDLPWAMSGTLIQAGIHGSGYDVSLPVHPTFLYESLWCLLGFVVLHILSKKAYKFSGQLFATYMIWYGTGRFLIEGLRTDSLYLNENIRVSQLLALLSVITGCVLLYVFSRYAKKLPKQLAAEEATVPLAQTDGEASEAVEEPVTEAAAETPAEAPEETPPEAADGDAEKEI